MTRVAQAPRQENWPQGRGLPNGPRHTWSGKVYPSVREAQVPSRELKNDRVRCVALQVSRTSNGPHCSSPGNTLGGLKQASRLIVYSLQPLSHLSWHSVMFSVPPIPEGAVRAACPALLGAPARAALATQATASPATENLSHIVPRAGNSACGTAAGSTGGEAAHDWGRGRS